MTFRPDKATQKAMEAIASAQQTASSQGNPEITALHLLSALLQEHDGMIRPILDRSGVERPNLESIVSAELSRLPSASGGASPIPGRDLSQVLELATKNAEKQGDDFVSTDHLLVALAGVDSTAKRLLELNGLNSQDLLEIVTEMRGSTKVSDQNPEAKFQALENMASILLTWPRKESSIR